MVRDLPPEERPREKLLYQGPRALSNAELLAILLRSGTKEKSVLRIAEEILAHIKEQGLSAMVHISAAELAKIDGVGQVKAATLQAAETRWRASRKADTRSGGRFGITWALRSHRSQIQMPQSKRSGRCYGFHRATSTQWTNSCTSTRL